MHEPLEPNRMSKTEWKAAHFGAGAGLLVVGLLSGRAFFPLEVRVERIVEKQVPVEVIKYVDRVVEKRVEVPLEKSSPVDRLETTPVVTRRVWPEMRVGISYAAVRAMLGPPDFIDHTYGAWYFANSGWVRFEDGVVSAWKEPAR